MCWLIKLFLFELPRRGAASFFDPAHASGRNQMNHKAWWMACLLITIAFQASCDAFDVGYTKIDEVVKNPSVFDGKEVKVRGKVVDVLKLPLVETKFYTVKDETGELLVITGAAPPGVGAEVRVRGSIESMAILKGQGTGLSLKDLRGR